MSNRFDRFTDFVLRFLTEHAMPGGKRTQQAAQCDGSSAAFSNQGEAQPVARLLDSSEDIAEEYSKPMHDEDVIAKLWRRVEKTETCWLWLGPKDWSGYGILSVSGGRHFRVHRLSYEIAHGPITDKDLFVCHRCDTPACVNPEHLFLGTTAENQRDSHLKGRTAQGERNGRHRVTEEAVLALRAEAAAGVSRKELVAKYGLSHGHVSLIIAGKKWAHLASSERGKAGSRKEHSPQGRIPAPKKYFETLRIDTACETVVASNRYGDQLCLCEGVGICKFCELIICGNCLLDESCPNAPCGSSKHRVICQ